MQRLRLYDLRVTDLPADLGLCQDNVPALAAIVNSAQQRLLYAREAGDDGWWGGWAEIAFNVSRTAPYITLPREIARLEALNICDRPVPIQNSFFEYLRFGNGRLPKNFACLPRLMQGYARNNAITFYDLTHAPQLLRAYMTDATDAGKRVLFQGLDANNSIIYSLEPQGQTTGVFVTLQAPFGTAPMTFNNLTGIQKDATAGQVQIYQVDPVTGEQVLLLTMEPSETTASYRRYYLDSLPCNCCATPGNPTTVQVKAIAKLELIPVMVDTDYCLIQNREAIREECHSIRYSRMDTPSAKGMASERHAQAIRLLNGELNHYMGMDFPAVEVRPFGSARLSHQKIGSLI